MNLNFQTIEMKNFTSFGNVTQTLHLNNKNLNLILGENVDSDATDHRNGTGKSSIANAISYTLFGKPLVGIRLDNLINKTNEKGMETAINFDKDGVNYRIERGRRPNKLLFYQESTCVNGDTESSDESQGDNRKTQEQIESILGINFEMFKNIVVLNTYSEPFLAMPAAQQRSFIESLLGISILSQKAEVLKEQVKKTKDEITEEEYRIKGIQNANKTIEDNIKRLVKQSNEWEEKHDSEISSMEKRLEELSKVDIEEEAQLHKDLSQYEEANQALSKLKRQKTRLEKDKSKLESTKKQHEDNLKKAKAHECHACGQTIHDEKHENIVESINTSLSSIDADINEIAEELDEVNQKIKETDSIEKPTKKPVYDKIDDVYKHSTILENLETSLKKEKESENPYSGQIESLQEEGLQKVDYGKLNEITRLKEHQDFLVKLLTSNQSFIRKEIIDKNLGYLNKRLEFYLNSVDLPHQIEFQNDLSVYIAEYGRELDFDNLSRGERTRLILALSWAFRDVYESLNGRINLLFVDELLDNGLDTSGAENSLRILKEMNRRMKRDVFLITHREEMHGRVDSIVKVLKKNGFSSMNEGEENVLPL